ncbi:MarR family transcriptional regulator [Streptomyces sp. NPDC055962]|uniref:MarR family transcriptional regulator n=1 Tax=Streptomyces sp. NPDC055962 TaxID=3345667 RepID=UPI0035E33EDB
MREAGGEVTLVAGYVDRLPDGAAMDIKSLAKSLPLYGQMAVSSALKALGVAGHLRRVRCLAGEGDQVRWVSSAYWSRTARDNEWWGAFLAAESSHSTPEATPVPSAPGHTASPVRATVAPATTPDPRRRLPPRPCRPPCPHSAPPRHRRPTAPRRTSPWSNSAAWKRAWRSQRRTVAPLEPLAAGWFARGVDADYLTHALTAGLPAQVGSPVGLVRRRLTDKLPPLTASSPAPATTRRPEAPRPRRVHRMRAPRLARGTPRRPLTSLPHHPAGCVRRSTL